MMMGPDTTFGVLPPSGDRGYAYYAYYADDFDFLEAETHGFDDPIAYVPDADWTVLMQRKSVIICASMGAGKWKCGCVYCYPTAASVGLVIPFHVILAIQQTSRFWLDCSVNLDDATIRASPNTCLFERLRTIFWRTLSMT
jgi:hypothetical protein